MKHFCEATTVWLQKYDVSSISHTSIPLMLFRRGNRTFYL